MFRPEKWQATVYKYCTAIAGDDFRFLLNFGKKERLERNLCNRFHAMCDMWKTTSISWMSLRIIGIAYTLNGVGEKCIISKNRI